MISVVVPAYNAQDTIGGCLAALQAQTVDPGQYEVILVDDGSSDRTAEVAGQYGVCVIRQENAGPAAARNRGAEAAQGEILLFTDADCEPAPDWIERMAAPFRDPEVAGAKGVYRTRQREWVARFVQIEYEHKYGRMRGLPSIDFVDTYSAAYRRDVFLGAGGFDEAYSTASVEDQEFSFRLARLGQRMVFVPQAVVYHRHNSSAARYARRKFGIGYWKALLLRRHPERMARDSHTPQTIKVQIGLMGLLCLVLPLVLFWTWARWLVLGLVASFLLSALPLLILIARRDPPVLLAAPWLLAVRALSLGTGLAAGMVRFWLRPRADVSGVERRGEP